jgi:apolipoprotein N-acyltransferase
VRLPRPLDNRRWVWPIASGILYCLSFPPVDIELFGWIALVPLLAAISNETPRNAFWIGFRAGIAAFLALIYWVTVSMARYGGMPWALTLIPLFLFVAYLGLYFGIFTALMVWIRTRIRAPAVFLAPVLWTALEWIRSHAFSGFPWGLIGYSQALNLPAIQISDLTGVYGVSFLVVLVNAAVADVIGMSEPGRRSEALRSVSIATVCLLAVYGYGIARIHHFDAHPGQPMTAGVVQADIPQDVKWDPAFREATLKKYERLTEQIAQSGAQLIVWPEAAMPFIFEDDVGFRQEVLMLAKKSGIPLLFGSPGRAQDANGGQWLTNSAFLVDARGAVVSRQDKMHLVPFGEYVPLRRILFFIDKLVVGIGDFLPGSQYQVMRVTGPDGKEAALGVVICFEVIFPDLVRQFVDRGARFMVTITNDAWFGRTSAPYQHFSMMAFRSVENRVPFIRAANTGISGFTDATGRILRTTPLFEPAALAETVSAPGERTVYTRAGDLFAYLCVIMSGALAIRAAARGRRDEQETRHAGRL